MDGIYNTDKKFDFQNLHLAKPQQIPGGNYFIRFSISNSPLYIRLPKCSTKQGFMKAGKRFYTDFMFSNENSDMIEWMEKLETFCQEKLFENRQTWFEGEMEMHDIENYFTSPLKLYKSGKYYLARVNVSTNLGEPNLKIYDEQQNLVAMNDVSEKQKVASIVEIKGIKCSATSFQIETEIKQMMVMADTNMFDTCLFAASPLADLTEYEATVEDVDSEDDTAEQNIIKLMPPIENADIMQEAQSVKEDVKMIENTLVEMDEIDDTQYNAKETLLEKPDEHVSESENNDSAYIEINETLSNELQEIDIPLEQLSIDDSISIRNKNSVYYEMYKEAKRKARVARDLANSSYLEARRIKNLYMLENTSDSDDSDDSDFDNK